MTSQTHSSPCGSALPSEQNFAPGADFEEVSNDVIEVRRFLSPNANKLFDFRKEQGFAEIAAETLSEKRTLLDYNRLLTLWTAVRNTKDLGGAVAEIGTYRGGSAKFIARALKYFETSPPIHVFDTFSGHADALEGTLDGEHSIGLFNDTSESEVREYLSDSPNLQVHAGRIEDTAKVVEKDMFSLVHVDVDVYAATAFCLIFFWERLLPGGVIIVDDYGFETCAGARHAVEYFRSIEPRTSFWYLHTGQAVLQKAFNGKIVDGCEGDLHVYKARLLEKDLQLQVIYGQLHSLMRKSAADKAFLESAVADLQQQNQVLRESAERLTDEAKRVQAYKEQNEKLTSDLISYKSLMDDMQQKDLEQKAHLEEQTRAIVELRAQIDEICSGKAYKIATLLRKVLHSSKR